MRSRRGWAGLIALATTLLVSGQEISAAEQVRVVAPGRRHVIEVKDGAVFLDGRRVHPRRGRVDIVGAPSFRRDGAAVAWLERAGTENRLVVLTDLRADADPWPWALPTTTQNDRLFWAGPQRIVVGPALLSPRAVASW
jgi:hypothetical protein